MPAVASAWRTATGHRSLSHTRRNSSRRPKCIPRIMLVEDNEMNHDMLSRRLTRKGYEVSIAIDRRQGLAMALRGGSRQGPPQTSREPLEFVPEGVGRRIRSGATPARTWASGGPGCRSGRPARLRSGWIGPGRGGVRLASLTHFLARVARASSDRPWALLESQAVPEIRAVEHQRRQREIRCRVPGRSEQRAGRLPGLGHVDGIARGRGQPAAGDPERVAGAEPC